MKRRISSKALMPVLILVGLAAILVYLGTSGRPTTSRPGAKSPVTVRPGPVAVLPPATPAPTVRLPAGTGTTPSPGPSSPQSPPAAVKAPAGTPAAGTQPSAAGTGQAANTTKPGTAQSAAPSPPPGATKPAPTAKPGAGPVAAPGTPPGGSAASKAPAVPATERDREAAFVGTGQQGRNDPFTPLVTPESQRASPAPMLPPPPGVGLPMPPGFAAPGGGPNAGLPQSPGAGMRVTGIMGSRNRVAIIEADGKTHIVGVGEYVGDAVVVQILPEKVIMRQHNVTFELGVGGDRSS